MWVLDPSASRAANHAANTGAEPDRDVQGLEVRHRTQEHEAVGGDAQRQRPVERAHHVQAAGLGQFEGMLVGGLEVVALLDQLGAESAHGTVLLDAIAVGDDDGGAEPLPGRSVGDALPMVAAGRGDDAADIGVFLTQRVHVDEAAADLERANRRVVLVLDPEFATVALGQQRPATLGRRREGLVDEGGRLLQLGEGRHR